MIARQLEIRWRSIPWRTVLLLSYVGFNLIVIPQTIRLGPDVPVDWQTFRALPEAITNGNLYALGTPVPFVWSPVAAWIMAGAALVGYWPWLALHVAVVFLLRPWLLVGLVLISYSFWFDAAQGNTLTFSLVAGGCALRGNRLAALVYLGLLVLIPRPILLPLALWLLWQRPDLRLPFLALFVVHAGLVFATGYALPWLATIAAYEPRWPGVAAGPTVLLGRWWLLIGIPLGVWLTWRGRLGWAGLAVSPYVAPQYLMWPLLELAPLLRGQPTTAEPTDSS
jgi:hypothetical protein